MPLPLSALALYVIGWLVAVRPAMRHRMLQQVCSHCQAPSGDLHYDPLFHGRWHYAPRGALRERNGRDTAWALFTAAWWPVIVPVTIISWLAQLFGAGVKRAVDYVSPLTAPELERRLAEQAREIERLTKQIGG